MELRDPDELRKIGKIISYFFAKFLQQF